MIKYLVSLLALSLAIVLPAYPQAISSNQISCTANTELPPAAVLADGGSNATAVPEVGSRTMLFNGTTWDRAVAAQVLTAAPAGTEKGVVTRNIPSGTQQVQSNSANIATESTLSTLNGKVTACNTGSVAGTVTCNAGTNLNTSSLALDATLTGGTQKAITRGGAKGATAAADMTSTAEGADHQALDVQIYSGGSAKDPTQIRALTSSDVVTCNNATAANLKVDLSGSAANSTAGLISSKIDQTTLGTTNGVTLVPATTGGLTTYHLVSAATTNATNIKASAGQICGWYIYNSNAAMRKVAFHNTSGTPTAGSSVFFGLPIPPGGGANAFTSHCIPFSSGIAITTTTGLADSDSTAVGANDLIINIFYK